MAKLLTISDTMSIPLTELRYRASRASGPGGQHVNTSSTRVEVLWDFERSIVLDEAGRARLRKKLATRGSTGTGACALSRANAGASGRTGPRPRSASRPSYG